MNAEGKPGVYNAYGRAVQSEGNLVAQRMLAQVFGTRDAEWRGFGMIPESGMFLSEAYAHRDAVAAFPVEVPDVGEPAGCACGDILRGVMTPPECPLYGTACTPRSPVGPCMVSGEGSCAAYYRYERTDS